ncbi:hypothetical protein [Cupriavidus agavae]|uniref:hypothetical protein n=1 Tax=Cupriavidus agavae TaxID=1001822 RepID=UPI001A7E7DF8|nr:hypothetical protein [Cupriavidus agavae]
MTLSIDRPTPPRHLSDFVGGSGEISDGYSDTKRRFQIEECTFDERRLELSFEHGRRQVLNPAFQRTYAGEIVHPLVVMPLACGQRLNLSKSDFESDEYVVTYSNWWEPIERRRR